MRRLSAILMIAALLAALIPSAVLAKPVPVIDSVTVTAKDDGLCTPGPLNPVSSATVTVAIQFSGKGPAPMEAQFLAIRDDVVVSSPRQPLERWVGTSEQVFEQVALGDHVWSFAVELLDRKGNPMGSYVRTSNETWTSTTSCPDYNPIASYPAP